jgi:hypothetical protein
MKKPIFTGSHVSRVARVLTQIGYGFALAAIPLLALGSAQPTEAQTTIQVTTMQQGVTDGSHCSLQEAIYAAEFASDTALNLTDPDSFYKTGCVLQGASGPFTIVLQKSVYSFNTFWDRDAHNPFGLTATPIIFTNITIQGNGATLQWTGSGNSRLFAVGSASIFDTLDNKTVSGTGALRLESVYIKGFKIKGGSGAAEAPEATAQVERYTSARLTPASQLSTSRTAPSIRTSPLAAMAATQVAFPNSVLVQVAAAVAYPAMVAVPAPAEAAEVAVAPEEMVGVEVLVSAEAEAEVAVPSSMVETVPTIQGAVEHTSAVAVAASPIMAMAPLAPVAEEVEEERLVAAS